jgi:hypothetical protein
VPTGRPLPSDRRSAAKSSAFHDAEILEIHLDRGHVEPEKNLYEFPSLTLKIHLWEMTKEVDHNGYFILRSHTLATLKFSDLDRLNVVGFNHQNAIMEMGDNGTGRKYPQELLSSGGTPGHISFGQQMTI